MNRVVRMRILIEMMIAGESLGYRVALVFDQVWDRYQYWML
jgi:hypothetical protein